MVDDFHALAFLQDIAWKCSREDNVFPEHFPEFVLSLTSSFGIYAENWNPFFNLVITMTSKTGIVSHHLSAEQRVVGHLFILLGQRLLTEMKISGRG